MTRPPVRLDALKPQLERALRVATTAWYSLSDEHREWLLKRRRRLLWWAALLGGLWHPPLLTVIAIAAYFLQPPPRRTTSPVLLTVFASFPVLWLRNAGADLGIVEDADELGVLVCALLAIAVSVGASRIESVLTQGATGVRPLLPWLRRGIDPRAYGIPPFRILLGIRGRAWITAPKQVGALVIGPPRSGKTSGVIIPNALAWTGPVVCTSTRRDVLDACHGARAQRGTVWCFDPVGIVASLLPTPVKRLDWSPLRGADNFDTAQARARALLAGAVDGTEGRDHWRARGTQLLGALLHAAALARLPMSAVVQWVHAGRLDAVEHVLRQTMASSAAAVIRGIAQTPDRERGSIWSAVGGGLAPFDDSSVLASADRAADCGFSAADFLGRPDTVFIVAPSDDATPLAPLVVGLVEEIRAEALRISNVAGALDLPLLLALDEIATICPLPSLPQIAAEGGGRNVLLLAVLQDFSQAAARWGREVADGLLTLAGTKLVLPGVADTDTLQRIEALAGKHWVQMISTSKMQGGGFWRDTTWGTQRSEMELPRHPAASVRELAPGTGLLLSGRSRAMRIRIIGWDIAPFRQWHADARRAANL